MSRTARSAYSKAGAAARRIARDNARRDDRNSAPAPRRSGGTRTPEQIADQAEQLVNGTPVAELHAGVTGLIFAVTVEAADPLDDQVRADLDLLAYGLRRVNAVLIDMARAAKRLKAKRTGRVAANAEANKSANQTNAAA